MTVSAKIKSMMSVKTLGIALTPIALVATGAFVVNQSSAAFSAETFNEADTWAAGKVLLSNDHYAALFSPKGIAPNYAESHCITVASGSDIPVNLKMYSKGLVSGALSSALLLKVEEGAGGTNVDGVAGRAGSCTGFAASTSVFDGTIESFGAKTNFASGVGATVIAPNETKQYRIMVSLPDSAPNTLQSTKSGVSFVWEAQS
jgi:hypothetical protein